jgi:hypothetical protein
MPPTNAAITPQLAARSGWEVARRDDACSARDALGGGPAGWQRGRRQLLEQTRAPVLGLA